MVTTQTSDDRVGEVLVRAPVTGQPPGRWDRCSNGLPQRPRQTRRLAHCW